MFFLKVENKAGFSQSYGKPLLKSEQIGGKRMFFNKFNKNAKKPDVDGDFLCKMRAKQSTHGRDFVL